MTEKEIEILNSNDWDECIEIIIKYWNCLYGTCEIWVEPDRRKNLELTTGGWSENEDIINEISNTMFWFLWWHESKRGGYYKFIYTSEMKYIDEQG